MRQIPHDSTLTCQGCAYPIRGLDVAAPCPECGRSVGVSWSSYVSDANTRESALVAGSTLRCLGTTGGVTILPFFFLFLGAIGTAAALIGFGLAGGFVVWAAHQLRIAKGLDWDGPPPMARISTLWWLGVVEIGCGFGTALLALLAEDMIVSWMVSIASALTLLSWLSLIVSTTIAARVGAIAQSALVRWTALGALVAWVLGVMLVLVGAGLLPLSGAAGIPTISILAGLVFTVAAALASHDALGRAATLVDQGALEREVDPWASIERAGARRAMNQGLADPGSGQPPADPASDAPIELVPEGSATPIEHIPRSIAGSPPPAHSQDMGSKPDVY
ncbi:MAG: hypothetical protein O2819_03210 [Planctomycetota bacterium]|nr:hypothetical protein [Planctomycetota bacterium]MDA1105747.1 hypothetical protein [Planctomycetota bacterium]